MNETAIARTDEEPVLVRPSRESDVEAMLAIYRHHVRSGVQRDVEGTGAPEPDDLRDRRKNLKQTRLPHLVATFRGEVVGYAYAVLFRRSAANPCTPFTTCRPRDNPSTFHPSSIS